MKCPGQDMQYWKPGAIYEVSCPKCGKIVEFFKDDTARKCGACGHRFVNPQMDFGCAAYCPYAEQCLGTLPEGLAAQKENLLKDRVAVEMKRYYKNDFKRIGHAGRVARYAERIGKSLAGNPAVILAAAYLRDIGSVEVAGEILTKLGAREELVAEVCDIIARPQPGPQESVNYQAVYDAELLENMDEQQKSEPLDTAALALGIAQRFLTDAGREAAKEILLNAR